MNNDAILFELVAACDALAEATERTNTIVHALAEAHILGKRPSARSLDLEAMRAVVTSRRAAGRAAAFAARSQ